MLAIAGGKGGCGKTTTTYRLAVELAGLGRPTLAADADAEMPDLHLVADVPARPGLPAVRDGRPPAAVAHELPDGDAKILPAAGVDSTAVPAALARLGEVEGAVLLDCPAGAGRDAARPLRAATRTLLVATPTRASLFDAVKTAEMARQLGTDPLGVILVERAQSRRAADGNAGRGVTNADAQRLFECPLLGRIPPAGDGRLGAVRRRYREVARRVNGRNV